MSTCQWNPSIIYSGNYSTHCSTCTLRISCHSWRWHSCISHYMTRCRPSQTSWSWSIACPPQTSSCIGHCCWPPNDRTQTVSSWSCDLCVYISCVSWSLWDAIWVYHGHWYERSWYIRALNLVKASRLWMRRVFAWSADSSRRERKIARLVSVWGPGLPRLSQAYTRICLVQRAVVQKLEATAYFPYKLYATHLVVKASSNLRDDFDYYSWGQPIWECCWNQFFILNAISAF